MKKYFGWIFLAGAAGLLAYEASKQHNKNKAQKKSLSGSVTDEEILSQYLDEYNKMTPGKKKQFRTKMRTAYSVGNSNKDKMSDAAKSRIAAQGKFLEQTRSNR